MDDCDAVIVATGGFSANREMIRKYRGDIVDLPTSNGNWTIGSGIDLLSKFDPLMVDMEQIQIHPTGFIDPKDTTSTTKKLAGEILRGKGNGILLTQDGERFCDEKDRRDKISYEMLRRMQSPDAHGKTADFFYILMDACSEANIPSYITNYMYDGLLKKYDKYEELEMSCGIKKKILEDHKMRPPLFIGKVVPVLHYCMGGVKTNQFGQVLCQSQTTSNVHRTQTNTPAVKGLYAIGEVTGGLHGYNWLGGNSLLECVVFGRIAGAHAATGKMELSATQLSMPMFPDITKWLGGIPFVNQFSKNFMLKEMTKAQFEKEGKDPINGGWIALNGMVYDVKAYVERQRHPGGKAVIQKYYGQDVSQVFYNMHQNWMIYDEIQKGNIDLIAKLKK